MGKIPCCVRKTCSAQTVNLMSHMNYMGQFTGRPNNQFWIGVDKKPILWILGVLLCVVMVEEPESSIFLAHTLRSLCAIVD